MGLTSLFLLAALGAYLLLGIALLFKAPKSIFKTSMVGVAFSSFFWAMGIFVFLNFSETLINLKNVNNSLYFFAGLITTFFLGLSIRFYTQRKATKLENIAIFLPIMGLSYSIFTNQVSIAVIVNGQRGIVLAPWFGSYYAFIILYFLSGMILLFLTYKKAPSTTLRSQVWCILWASGLTGVINITFNLLLLPVYNYRFLWAGPLSSFFWVSIISYAVTHHRLLDIQVVISRGIARVFTLTLLIVSYLGLGTMFQFLAPHAGITVNLTAGTILLIATHELYPWLRNKIQTIPDKILVKRHFNFEEVSWNLSESLMECVQLNEVIPIINRIATQDMKLEVKQIFVPQGFDYGAETSTTLVAWDIKKNKETTVALDIEDSVFKFVLNQQEIVTVDDTEPTWIFFELCAHELGACVPFISKGAVLGVITLANRPEKSGFTYDDMMMFRLLKSQIGMSLDRVRMFSRMAIMTHLQKSASLLGMINHYTHDIKAPLNSLSYIIDELPGLTGAIKMSMETQIKRVFDLVKTMLEVASGNKKREPKPLLLPQVLHNVFKFYRCNIPVSGNWAEPVPRPYVQGVDNDLLVLFTNIIKNAAEAQATQVQAKPEIMINMEVKTQNVIVTLADRGPGIPQEKLDKLFEYTSSTKIDGSGVGLQAIKSIAKEHHATVSVESKIGVGTTFTVSLPILDLPWAIYEKPADYFSTDLVLTPNDKIASNVPPKHRILILEDEEILCTGLKRKLLKENFEVLSAENGEAGLAILEKEAVDCILLDLNMPVMDGRRFMVRLNQTQTGKNIPVLVCSSESPANLTEEFAKHLNCKGVIDKFLKTEQLIDHIVQALS